MCGDSHPEMEANLVACAQRSVAPQQMVLAHANLPTVTQCDNHLSDLITSRNLQTVTINDVFARFSSAASRTSGRHTARR
jgi:peptidoglycan-N-acetylglucosamine deacetylase